MRNEIDLNKYFTLEENLGRTEIDRNEYVHFLKADVDLDQSESNELSLLSFNEPLN